MNAVSHLSPIVVGGLGGCGTKLTVDLLIALGVYAGPGQWRGGLGVETIFEIGSDDTQVVIFGDGDVEPAFGLHGGGAGSLNSIRFRYPDGREHVPLSLDLITGVPRKWATGSSPCPRRGSCTGWSSMRALSNWMPRRRQP